MHQRQIVDAGLHERPQHQRNDIGRTAGVSPGAADRAHAIGQHAALGIEREFAGRCQVAAVGAANEFVGAVAAPADLLAELGGGIGHYAVFRIEVGLLAKAAADVADQHANAFLRPLQHGFGQHVAGRARRLRLDMKRQPPGFLVDLGDRRAWLHRRRHQALADKIERDFMRRARERLFHLGSIAIAHGGHDVVVRLGPYHRRAGLDRFDGIDHRGQHLVIHHDRFRRGLRQHPRGRDDGRDRLAGKAYYFVGEQAPRRHRHRLAVRPLEDRQGRDGADVVLDQVGAGIDCLDARHRLGVADVDRDDFGVGVRRTQHVQPQRAVVRLVVDELPLPGEQPLVFQTLDRLARTKTQIAGKNVHQFVL